MLLRREYVSAWVHEWPPEDGLTVVALFPRLVQWQTFLPWSRGAGILNMYGFHACRMSLRLPLGRYCA